MSDNPKPNPLCCGHCGYPWMGEPSEILASINIDRQQLKVLGDQLERERQLATARDDLARTNYLRPDRPNTHAAFVAAMEDNT